MQPPGPKRIYTPQSLEFWFEKLESDWARHFSAGQLDEGRRIYRDSEVRELELTDRDAIIHRRVQKKDEYAVIEWENGRLNIRSSSTDQNLANALAIAGLHEIEELVCDEVSPLPLEITGLPAGGRQGSGLPPSDGAPAARPAPTASGPARPLLLVFTIQPAGLAFEAFWQNPGGVRVPALGQAAPDAAKAQPAITSAERARLIGLAACSRKAHFAYDQKTGLYLLGSIGALPDFLKNILPAWKRLFAVEIADGVSLLLDGPRAIEIEAVASTRVSGKSAAGGAGGAGGADGAGGAGGARPGGVLNLRWIFKAGERLLSDKEAALVARRGAQPTLLPGIGIVTLAPGSAESFDQWQRNLSGAGGPDRAALSPYLIFSLFNDTRLKLTLSPELEAWRRRVLTPPAPPAPFAPTAARPAACELPALLRPYQRRGVEWMSHLADNDCHGLLADEMGLGKTLQVLSLLASRPVPGKPSLIVCPASVVPVWQEEIAQFFPKFAVEVLKNTRDFAARPGGGVLWLASYAQLRRHREQLDAADFAYAVLDEGQFIKNPDAKTTKTCFAIRAAHRVVLSGTPLENRQLDLWSIFRYLLPGLLGTRAAFESALAADREGTLARIRAQIAPFILRRTKREVATELPQKVEMELLCPLTDVQRAEYARICSEGLDRLGDDMNTALRKRSFGFLALLTRLRQICCDPGMVPWLDTPVSESGKINLLVEKLAEIISGGHKVVIFSQFVMLLDRVHEALAAAYPDLPRFEITGMTADRLKPVQAFQGAAGPAAFLVSLKAGGTGITLHAADYIFLLDPWWNPAVEEQAVDRVHRIGQTSTVFVYRMVTAGTIEERIQALKETKRDLFEKLVGGLGGDFDLTQHFSSLRDLLQLTTNEVIDPEAEFVAI
ncbi:MAG: DEAD/DEAH box helicase [Opitutaceae bacterium]|jgi:superfamily II DNA or RNA helicase|nr:DEAD/DEAH box helicase [Opitutaceae bacterium]